MSDPRTQFLNEDLKRDATPSEMMSYVMDRHRDYLPKKTPTFRAYSQDNPEAVRDFLGMQMAPVGWANSQQRADARAAYAIKGTDPEDMRERWDKSRLLVDPNTQKAQEKYLRDFNLLRGLLRKDDPEKVKANYFAPLDTQLAPEMLNFDGPSELGDGSPDILNTRLLASVPGAVLRNLMDPESGAGWYMGRANLFPSMGKYAGGGEAKDYSEALGMAAGDLGFKEMHRMGSRVPVADLPSDATPAQIRSRVGGLAKQAPMVEAPQYKERYLRTVGYDPGPVVGFLSDLGYDFMDPSLLVDVAAGPAKALINPTARAYMAAQGGLLKNLMKQGAGEFVMEAATELPLAAAITAMVPSGGKAYDDHDVKTPKELEQAKELRRQYELKHFGSQDPDEAAYNQVVKPTMKRRLDALYPGAADIGGTVTPSPFAPLPNGWASNR